MTRSEHDHDATTHGDTGREAGQAGHEDVYPQERAERRVEREEPRRSRASALTSGSGDGLSEFLSVFYRVSRLVLLTLAVVCLLGIAFTLIPTNEDNVIVRNVLSLSEWAAGPFSDVFEIDGENARIAANYGLAAAVYALLASFVSKLPTGRSTH